MKMRRTFTLVMIIGLTLILCTPVALAARKKTIKQVVSQVQSFVTSRPSMLPCNTTFTQNLTVGSTGSDATKLQAYLWWRGFLAIKDFKIGTFTASTATALKLWQGVNGVIPADGYFGEGSRVIVNKDLACVTASAPTTPIASTTPPTETTTPSPTTETPTATTTIPITPTTSATTTIPTETTTATTTPTTPTTNQTVVDPEVSVRYHTDFNGTPWFDLENCAKDKLVNKSYYTYKCEAAAYFYVTVKTGATPITVLKNGGNVKYCRQTSVGEFSCYDGTSIVYPNATEQSVSATSRTAPYKILGKKDVTVKANSTVTFTVRGIVVTNTVPMDTYEARFTGLNYLDANKVKVTASQTATLPASSIGTFGSKSTSLAPTTQIGSVRAVLQSLLEVLRAQQ